ncbi:RNA 2'-phosphotransferase [Oryzibacter oryziterrae]|uniref:RNA 2'-phosphotransferase n=1 Tax=Oryzibacter oryziterrae TaxID=2766474 RepID=UPI001F017C95|nr:RNA 2'-phosphotransferase [Oryzibacter oryziterrae]
MSDGAVKLSKFVSYILRHKPESIGLVLDAEGWARIDELLEKGNASGVSFGRDELLELVANSDKKRFSLSEDGLRIRAAQGHSVEVTLGLEAREPPSVLYHGTATRFLDAILVKGLTPQSRQQVHLSVDVATATKVGQRHGKPVVLVVGAQQMFAKGFRFFQADNGVWLTDHVPPQFLRFGETGEA